MKNLFAGSLISLALVTAIPAATISDAVGFGSDLSGAYTGGIVSTNGCCQFLTVSQSLSGSPTISLPYTLVNGTQTLYFQTGDYGWTPDHGFNLFFDGSTTPGISVFAPDTLDTNAVPAFSADSAACTASLTAGCVQGSGTTSVTFGGNTLTLTDYRTLRGNASPNGSQVLQATFVYGPSETGTVPEPATLVLFGSALSGVILLRRRLQNS